MATATSRCIVCLAQNANMVNIQGTELMDLYILFVKSNIPASVGMPCTVCPECLQQMQLCSIYTHALQNPPNPPNEENRNNTAEPSGEKNNSAPAPTEDKGAQ